MHSYWQSSQTKTKVAIATPYTGKYWRTIQVKAIGEENSANKLQSVAIYAKYIFGVSVNFL